MKKKSFLSGINAKLAFAVVALAGTMFASCEKEELTVTPVDPSDPNINIDNPVTIEAGDATATIAITVFDADTHVALIDGVTITDASGATVQRSIPVAAVNGAISAETRIYTATKDGYITAQGIAVVPQLSKGQTATVPVEIFMQKIENAGTNYNVTVDPGQTSTENEAKAPESVSNTGTDAVTLSIPYKVLSGQTVENLEDIYAQIDGLVPDAETRMSRSEVRAVLKSKVDQLNTGIRERTDYLPVLVPAYYAVTITTVVQWEISIQTISLTVDGVAYEITGIKVKKVVSNTVQAPQYTPLSHDMGHGHGDNPTSGGGAGDAE